MADGERSARGQVVAAVLLVVAGLLAGVRALADGFWETTRAGVPLGPAAVVLLLVGGVLGYRSLRA